MNNIEIGKRIKQERERLNLTLKDIALDIGVAISTIQRYENGLIKEIKLPVIQAIANSLSVNPDWLIGKNNSKYVKTENKEITDLNQQRLNDIYNTLTDEYKEKAIALLIELSIECSEKQIKKANENKAYMAALGGGVTEISPELAQYIIDNAVVDKIDKPNNQI